MRVRHAYHNGGRGQKPNGTQTSRSYLQQTVPVCSRARRSRGLARRLATVHVVTVRNTSVNRRLSSSQPEQWILQVFCLLWFWA